MRSFYALAPLAAVALSACQPQSAEVYVDKSWVRLNAVPGQPAAAYFRLTGGQSDDSMFAIHADQAIKIELHETMAGMNGMSGMKPMDSVKIPARAKVMFQPGGMHAMIYGLDSSVQPGSNITLTYVFKSGLRLQDSAVVVGAGDPAPKL